MTNRIKKIALTGISTLMIFSATALPSFANEHHFKGDNHPPMVHKVDIYHYDFRDMHKLSKAERARTFENWKREMRHLSPRERQEMRARWERDIRRLPDKERDSIVIDFNKIGVKINIK